MARAMEKAHFYERVFLEQERSYLEKKGAGRAQSAAAMFAAKEAVAKALGAGFTHFGFSDIEILPDAAGRPVAALYGNARREGRVHVSIAHDSGVATAFAVWEE